MTRQIVGGLAFLVGSLFWLFGIMFVVDMLGGKGKGTVFHEIIWMQSIGFGTLCLAAWAFLREWKP